MQKFKSPNKLCECLPYTVMSIQPTAFVASIFLLILFCILCVPRHTFLLSTEENMKENEKTKKKRNEWIECKSDSVSIVPSHFQLCKYSGLIFLKGEGKG